MTDGSTAGSTRLPQLQQPVRRLLREPLLVFLIAGIAMFALYAWVQQRGRTEVVLSAGTRARLVEEFESVVGRRASADERARLERNYVAEALLAREAVDDGVHLTDPGVRARLVEAVRRRVAADVPEPTDEEIVDFYAEHLELYRSEATIDFVQVYFRVRPAPGVLERLQAGEAVRGDEAAQGTVFPDYGESMIRGMFGEPLLAALRTAPLGAWSGPYESPHGWHYVRPAARRAGVLLPFDAVRDQVADDCTAAAIEQAVDAHVARLHERYEVRIEEAPRSP